MRTYAACLAVALCSMPAEAARIKLGAPGLSYVNLPQDLGDFFLDRYAQQLEVLGVRVITRREITESLSRERQRQILGCADQDSSCVAELADALGVDGVITGSLGRFGKAFQLNLVIVGSSDAELLSAYSSRAADEGELLDVLTTAAHETATELGRRLNRPVTTWSRNALSVSPLDALFDIYTLEYERVLSIKRSLIIEPSISIEQPLLGSPGAANGLQLSAGLRHYFMQAAPSGVFAGLRLQLVDIFVVGNEQPGNAIGLGPGVEVGYSVVLWSHLLLSVLGKAHLWFLQLRPLDGSEPQADLRFVPNLAVRLGWAF